MLVNVTVGNVVEAKEQVESLDLRGFSRNNIYVFTHSKETNEAIADALHTEEVGVEEQGVVEKVKNFFSSRGDELRSEMQAVGLSQADAEKAERELDEGRIVIVAQRDL